MEIANNLSHVPANSSCDTGSEITLSVPDSEDASEKTVHVILTVQDDGAPSLVAYRRAIISID